MKKIKSLIFLSLLFACLFITHVSARVHLEDFNTPGKTELHFGTNPTSGDQTISIPISVKDGELCWDFSNLPKDNIMHARVAYQTYTTAENSMYIGFTFNRSAVENTRVRMILRNYNNKTNGETVPFSLDGEDLVIGKDTDGLGNIVGMDQASYDDNTGLVAVYAKNEGSDCRVKVWVNGVEYEYVESNFSVAHHGNTFQTQFWAGTKLSEGDTIPTISFDNIKILQDEEVPTGIYAAEPQLMFDFENFEDFETGGKFFMSENTFPFYRVKSVRQLANFSNQTLTCENILAQYGDQDKYKLATKTLAPGEVVTFEMMDDAATLDGVKTIKTFVWDNLTDVSPIAKVFQAGQTLAQAERPVVLAEKLTRVGDTHPRILTTAADLAKVAEYKEDETFAHMYEELLDWEHTQNHGGYYMTMETLPNHGSATGSIADMIYDRATIWGYLYQTNGDEALAERLMNDMVKLAEYPNWYDDGNYEGGQFLYTAHIAAAVAIGYDMIYDYLSKEENLENRAKIEKAIHDNAVVPFLRDHRANKTWTTWRSNWSLICNSGVGLACLAIGNVEDYQADCAIALNYALRGCDLAAGEFAPEGGWTEGYNYYPYMMRHGTDFFAALINTMGDDHGYLDYEGMNASAADTIRLAGSKYVYAYSDAPMTAKKGTYVMMYFAKYLDMPELGLYRRAQFEETYELVKTSMLKKNELENVLNFRDLLWYDPDYSNVPVNAGKVGYDDTYGIPLDYAYRGLGVVALHTDYGDTQGFAAANFGHNNEYHNHTDMGGFIYESQGEQWFIELGYVDYDWPAPFDDLRYRHKPEGHNCMIFNPVQDDTDQVINAKGSLAQEPVFGEEESYFVMDLTNGYADRLNSYKRLIYLDKDTQGFAVKDKFSIRQDAGNKYYWFAHTKAEISIDENDPSYATLTQNGKSLRVHVDGGVFSVMDATRLFELGSLSADPVNFEDLDPNNPIIVKKLAVYAEEVPGDQDITITVTAVPLDDNDQGTLPDVSHIEF